jgi:cysteine desulfurase
MLANNETGVVQPVAAAAEIAHAHGALLHCDAVQAAGRLAVSLTDLGADSLSLSAHKIGGPMGCGALVLRPGSRLKALFAGGRQESGRRPGTENVPAIVGFGVAAEIVAADTATATALAAMRDDLETRLVSHLPAVTIYGAGAPRLPNTSCFSTPGLDAATQVMALDLAGVAVGAGAACSSGKVQTSHVLAAMGVPAQAAGSAIRVSFGWDSRPDDVDRFLAAWRALLDRRAAKAAAIRAVAPGRASG